MAQWLGDNVDTSQQLTFPYSFRPIYYFSRVGGQMPFTIIYHTNSTIVGTKFFIRDFVWLAISLGIHIYFIHLAIESFKSYEKVDSADSILYFCNITIWFLSLPLGICTMIMDAYNRFKIIKILNRFTIFDKEVVGVA